MSFRNRVHVLSDQLEGDAPIVWRRDWLSLLVLALDHAVYRTMACAGFVGSTLECEALWDAKGSLGRHKAVCCHLCYHWYPVGHCIYPVPSCALHVRAPQYLVVGLFHTLCWWFWWGLLTPTFALACRACRSEDSKDKAGALTSRASATAASAGVRRGSRSISVRGRRQHQRRGGKGDPSRSGYFWRRRKSRDGAAAEADQLYPTAVALQEEIEAAHAMPVTLVPQKSRCRCQLTRPHRRGR